MGAEPWEQRLSGQSLQGHLWTMESLDPLLRAEGPCYWRAYHSLDCTFAFLKDPSCFWVEK